MTQHAEALRQISNQPSDLLKATVKERLAWAGKIPPGAEHPPMPSKRTKDQNFLVRGEIMRRIVEKIDPRSLIIEVGSGVGVLTEALAEANQRNVDDGNKTKILGIELDKAFYPIFPSIHNHLPEIGFSIGDALKALNLNNIPDERQIQIVSNLPFSIAKEFLAKLAGTHIYNAILFLGEKSLKEIKTTDTASSHYGHMSLIAQTFFETESIAEVGPGSFYPKSDTTGEVVVITPLSPDKMRKDTPTRIFSQIIKDTQPKNPPRPKDPTEKSVVYPPFEPPTVLTSISRLLGQPEATLLEGLLGITSQADGVQQGQTLSNVLQKPFFELEKNEVRELVNFVQQQFTLAS